MSATKIMYEISCNVRRSESVAYFVSHLNCKVAVAGGDPERAADTSRPPDVPDMTDV